MESKIIPKPMVKGYLTCVSLLQVERRCRLSPAESFGVEAPRSSGLQSFPGRVPTNPGLLGISLELMSELVGHGFVLHFVKFNPGLHASWVYSHLVPHFLSSSTLHLFGGPF